MNVTRVLVSAGVLFFMGGELIAQQKSTDTTKTANIEEVVVVAYGTQTKQSIAGSISTISAKDLEGQQSSNAVQSLSGKVGGVQIQQSSGQPGAAPQVRFRGIGSLSSSNDPLYVVDGVPFNGNINSISSQDIESISFLKDASANALYGSRGANGVIIISTKKAKKGLSITYDTKFGVNSRAVSEYDIISSPSEFYEAFYSKLKNDYIINGGMSSTEAANAASQNMIPDFLVYNSYNVANSQLIDPSTGKINSSASLLYSDDWQKNIFKNRLRQEHAINISGGSDKVSSYFSLGYLKDEGYIVNSGFERYSARTVIDYKITDKVRAGGNVNYGRTVQNAPLQGWSSGNYGNITSWARNIAPIYPIWSRDSNGNFIYDTNGERLFDFGKVDGPMGLARPYAGSENPFAVTSLDTKNNTEDNLSGRAYFEFDFLKNFNFRYNVGYDLVNGSYTDYGNTVGGSAAAYGGSIQTASSFDTTLTNQQLLSWKKTIGKHGLDILIGHETSDFKSKMLAGSKTNITIPDLPVISNAARYSSLNGFNDLYKVEGYFSRLNYNFNNSIFFNASYRRDGSSVFHPDNRWGNFFGLGAAWVLTNERFLSGNKVLTNLKLKASYGEQGNDNLYYPPSTTMNHRSFFGFLRNYYAYQTQYEIVPDASGNSTIREVYTGNKDLKWETSKNLNVGFELSLFNRVDIDAEYFERGVSDLLYNFPLSPSTGTQYIPRNVGDMKNKGVEVSINANVVKSEDFSLNIFANGTYYKNEITALPQPFTSGVFRFVEGEEAYTFYMRKFAGVDKEDGSALWYVDEKDADGNVIGQTTTKTYNSATLYLSDKTLNPKVYGGFGLALNYKGLSLAANFAYQYGGYMYDNVYNTLLDSGAGDYGANMHRDFFNTWTPENTAAALPMADITRENQFATSDMFLIKSDYISLQDASISYDFNPNFLTDGIKGIRLGVYGTNLWMKSKRKGMDPRLTSIGSASNNGLSLNEYGTMRTISLGLTVKF